MINNMQVLNDFDIFEWYNDKQRPNKSIKKISFSGVGNAYLLGTEFFQTYIESSITQTSRLHPIYCVDIPSSEVISIRDNTEPINPIPKTKVKFIKEFFKLMSDSYEPSIYGFKCLNSCTFSLFLLGSTEKNSKEFIVYGYALYRVDPLAGLVIVFLHVKQTFQKEGIGTAIMQCLQHFSSICIGFSRVLVWITKVANTGSNNLISFYRNRGFFPTIVSNLPLTYIFPSDLVEVLSENDANAQKNTKEFMLECRKKICKQPEQELLNRKGLETYVCDICNFKQKDSMSVCLCEYTLKNSYIKMKPKSTRSRKKNTRSICGVMICYNCHSNFGCTLLNRCPLHHHDEELIYIDSDKTDKVEKKESERRERIRLNISDSYSKSIDALRTQSFFCQDIYDTDVTSASYCVHCKLSKTVPNPGNNDSYRVVNCRTIEPSQLKTIINNAYDVMNFRIFDRQGLTRQRICPFADKDTNKIGHQLAFTSNSGKPSSLLCNRLFGIRNVDGHGDCGVLCLLFAILSSKPDDLTKVSSSIQTYIDNNVQAKSLFTNKLILTVEGIRELLFFAKIDENNPNKIISETDFACFEDKKSYDQDLSKAFDLYGEESTDENLKLLRSLFIQSRATHAEEGVYWLTQNDMLNMHYITGGLVCVLIVFDEDNPEKNNHKIYVHDCGYNSFNNGKCILNESTYFILVRHVGGEHYDLFYDRKRKTCLFPTDAINESDSAISIFLQVIGPKISRHLHNKVFELDQSSYGYESQDGIPDIPVDFYHEIPTFSKWVEQVHINHHIYKSIQSRFIIFDVDDCHLNNLVKHQKMPDKSESEINSISFHRNLIEKYCREEFIPIIFNIDAFEKDHNYACLGSIGYIQEVEDESFQPGHIGITDMCRLICNEEIFKLHFFGDDINNREEFFHSDQWRIATKEDLNKGMQKYAYESFLENVHHTGSLQSSYRSLLGKSTIDHYTHHDLEIIKTLARLSNDVDMKKMMFVYHLMLHVQEFDKELQNFTDSLLYDSRSVDSSVREVNITLFFNKLRDVMKDFGNITLCMSFINTDEMDIVKTMSSVIDEERNEKSSTEAYKKVLGIVNKTILKKDKISHVFTFFSYLCNEDFKSPKVLNIQIEKREWVELIADIVYDDEYFSFESNESFSTEDRNILKNMRFAVCMYLGIVDFKSGTYGFSKNDVEKLMKDYKTNHQPLQDIKEGSDKENVKVINTSIPPKVMSTNQLPGLLSDTSKVEIQILEQMPKLANDSSKEIEYYSKFTYDAEGLLEPKKFVPLDEWMQSEESVSPERTACLTSSTIGFSLTYSEIYGRLLGLENLLAVSENVHWLNSSIIDASISLLLEVTRKSLVSYLSQNHGIAEIPNDIFTSVVYVTDTKFYTHFVDGMKDIEEARDSFDQITYMMDYHIYLIPWILNNRHWVLLYIDIEKKEIFVLDSSVKENLLNESSVQEMLRALRFICFLCNEESKENEEHEDLQVNSFSWINVPEGVYPQLIDKRDCGVFLLMTIKSILSSNGILFFYTSECTKTFRDYIFQSLKSRMARDERFLNNSNVSVDSRDSSENDESPENDQLSSKKEHTSKNNHSSDHSTLSDSEDDKYVSKPTEDDKHVGKQIRKTNLKSNSIAKRKNKKNGIDKEKNKNEETEKTLEDIIVMYQANEMMKKLRGRHVKQQQFNESVNSKLNEIKVMKTTKYIQSVKRGRNGDYDYFVSTSNSNDPKTESGGKNFFQLRYEFVDSRCFGAHVNKNVVNFMNLVKKKEGIWCEMSKDFKKVFHDTALKEDREWIIRRNCSYSMVSIKNPNHATDEKFFASIIIDGKKVISDELTYEELKKRNLLREVRELRSKNVENDVYLRHGASSDRVKINYRSHWPKIVFRQGNTNNCLLRSVGSVIFYLIYEAHLNKNVSDYLLLMLNTLNDSKVFNTATSASRTLIKITEYMRAYGFMLEIFSKKRKRGRKKKRECNILSTEFNKGIFCIVQICGSDCDTNHTVCVTEKWIFDSNHERALPFCLHSFNICCSSHQNFVKFEKCEAVYKFTIA